MAQQGAALIVDVLSRLPLTAQPQIDVGVTYAAKISKAEAWLDWRQTAVQLERQVRAFNPSPGAACIADGSLLKVWSSEVLSGSGAPGTILAADRSGIVVACGEGVLRLVELQKSGGNRLPVAQFIAGHRIRKGACCALTAA
jgi:methionyl-tRNA formyltransferase